MRSPRILALDVGAGHVSAARFAHNSSGLELEQFVQAPLGHDPADEPGWAGSLGPALGALAASGKVLGPAALAIPGHLVWMKRIRAPSVASTSRHHIVAFEAAENIPYPLSEVVWDHWDVSDNETELETILMAAKLSAMQAVDGAVERAGFRLERAIPSGLALYRSFTYNYPDITACTLVIDAGARTTQLLFVDPARRGNDTLGASPGRKPASSGHAGFWVRTLPLGGNVITLALASELQIDFGSAEALKLSVLDGDAGLSDHPAARVAVQRAAGELTQRLLVEITRSRINYCRQFGAGEPGMVLLTGGGSLVPDLTEQLGMKLRITVRRFEALRQVNCAAGACATGAGRDALGMANLVGLAAGAVAASEREPDLLPPERKATVALRRRSPGLIAAAVSVVVALAPPIAYFHQVATDTLARVGDADNRLEPLRRLRQRIEEGMAGLDEATRERVALRRAYDASTNWIAFLAGLQERLATVEDVWLDRLKIEPPGPAQPGEAGMTSAAGASGTAPVRMALRGRLLDVANPESKVSPESVQRVKQLLTSFAEAPFIAAVENERFDMEQNGVLRFDFTLVIDPRQPL